MEINDSGKGYFSPLDLFSYSQFTIERVTARFEIRMWNDKTNSFIVMLINDKQSLPVLVLKINTS